MYSHCGICCHSQAYKAPKGLKTFGHPYASCDALGVSKRRGKSLYLGVPGDADRDHTIAAQVTTIQLGVGDRTSGTKKGARKKFTHQSVNMACAQTPRVQRPPTPPLMRRHDRRSVLNPECFGRLLLNEIPASGGTGPTYNLFNPIISTTFGQSLRCNR